MDNLFDFERLPEDMKVEVLNRLSIESKGRIMCFSECYKLLANDMAGVMKEMKDPENRRKYISNLQRIREIVPQLLRNMVEGETGQQALDRLKNTKKARFWMPFGQQQIFLSQRLGLSDDGVKKFTKKDLLELVKPLFDCPRSCIPDVPLVLNQQLCSSSQWNGNRKAKDKGETGDSDKVHNLPLKRKRESEEKSEKRCKIPRLSDTNEEIKRIMLVLGFGLGRRSFCVSVLEVCDGVYAVLSTFDDTHLGIHDFAKRIIDWLAASFKKDEGIDLLKEKQALERLIEIAEKAKMELSSLTQTNISFLPVFKKDEGIDLMKEKQALERLIERAEKAKMELSSLTKTNISLPLTTATADGPKHLETTITWGKFEELFADLLGRIEILVRNSLKEAKLTFGDVDEAILVGDSIRIHAVQQLIKELTGKDPNVNPDEIVRAAVEVESEADNLVKDVGPKPETEGEG